MKKPQVVVINVARTGTRLPPGSFGAAQAQDVDGDQGAETAEDQVDRMGTGVDQKIDFLGTVMDGMETPEEGDFVAQAMGPVVADFGNDQGGDGFEPERPGCGDCQKTIRNGTVDDPGQHADWTAEHSGGEKAADEKVAQIGADSFAENFLRMDGEETLEGNEDDDQNRQPNGQAAES